MAENNFSGYLRALGCASTMSFLSLAGCATPQSGILTERYDFIGDPQQQKNIFVFLDGTSNDGRADEKKATNVWPAIRLEETRNSPGCT
jgi:hypothetical protein